MGDFKDLKVWQRSMALCVKVYRITSTGEFSRDFGLRDQVRKASVSIPSNIAEGDESGSNKQAVRFFKIAKGSTAEVQTQMIIAHEIGYIDKNVLVDIEEECIGISGMLMNLIKVRSD